MSIYILVYLIVVCLFFISLINKRYVNICYNAAFVLMTVFLCLRAGQGSDYPAYEWIYNVTPAEIDFNNALYTSGISTVEHGWWIVCNVFRSVGLPFEMFVSLLGLFEMVLINRFINRMGICRYKVLVLLLAYPTFYFTFLFSGLRQALVSSIFLGVLLPWFVEGKHKRYIFLTLLLTNVHSVALIMLTIFVVKIFTFKQIKMIFLVSFVLGLMISIVGPSVLAPLMYALNRGVYLEYFGISIFSLLERLVMASFVLYLNSEYENKQGNVEVLVKYYLVGTCIYISLMAFPLIVSRLCFMFKVVEIWIIPKMLSSVRKERRVQISVILVAITCLMTLKNINSSISEGSYRENVNVFNYPYVTLFNPDEIREYRDSRYYDLSLEV